MNPENLIFRGRKFSYPEVELIKNLINRYPNITRRKLSKMICELINWKQPNGILKDRACRDALLRMNEKGIIDLPPIRTNPRRKRRRAIERLNEKDKRIKELEEENRVLREKLKEEHQKPFKAYKKEEKSLNKEPSRRGAPVGHQGITRKKPEKIDEYKDIRADTCPICGSPDIRDSGKFEEHYPEDREVQLFATSLIELLKESMELKDKWKQGKVSTKEIDIENFRERLLCLARLWIDNKEVKVLQKRLIKHEGEIFTFLEYLEVEPTNNRAERGLRGNVISRKLSYGNKSESGLRNHEVIMSLTQTAKLNGQNPLDLLINLCNGSKTEDILINLFGRYERGPP